MSARVFCKRVWYLNRYQGHLFDVRELKITKTMADQIIDSWYAQDRYHDYPVLAGNGRIFPALEVVVWPFLEYEWPANPPREICETVSGAAVRWFFVNPTLRTVLAPL